MESPAAASTRSGTSFMPSMVTRCVLPAAIRSDDAASAAARASARTARSMGSALSEAALQVLRMIQVGGDRRPHLLDQTLQLGVLRARDESLVDRVEHGLMVGHLVIDVGLV